MNKAKIISIANHKGGVGKTTTTANVGSILASMGKRVLVVDLDAQSNLTVSLLREEPELSIYHALTGKSPVLPIKEVNSNLSLVPASLQLAVAETELSSALLRERILSELLAPLQTSYDYILIDCPPSLGLLTLNAITASDGVVIPLVAEVLPFKGLTMISDFVGQVHRRLNAQTHIAGILLTRWEGTKLAREIESRLRNQLGDLVFKTRIRKNVTVAEAPLQSKGVYEFDPKCNGAHDYQSFTMELLDILEQP